MKTFTTLLLLATLSAGIPAESFAADQLLVVGRILEEGKRSEGAVITVYNGNDVYRTVTTPKNGKYALKLPLGFYFTMEIAKDGYVTKRLVFDTRTDESIAYLDDYVCDVDLINTEWFGNQDLGALDFPMAMIRYMGNGQFDIKGDYEEVMRLEYEALIRDAMNSTSAQLSRR